MSVQALQSFFAMGGYAVYVWPAYAVFFIVLIADTCSPIFRRRRLLRELNARVARQSARQGQASDKTSPTQTTP